MERLVQFELLGQEFAFYSGAPEEEVDEILTMVKNLVMENCNPNTAGSIAVGKVAVLASLNIASKYVELKHEFENYRLKTDARIVTLAQRIDRELSAEKKSS